MRNTTRISRLEIHICALGILSTALLLACGCSSTKSAQSSPPPDGRQLFTIYCAGCHGAAGANDRAGAVPQLRIAGSKLTANQISPIIVKGRGDMPSLSGHLSSTEIATVARFAEELAAKSNANRKH